MKNNNTDAQYDHFSKDPEENLRIENEILHLKLKAELGGEFMSSQELPPDLENKFLKNVLEFEHAFANTQQVKIFDFLGGPSVKKSGELDDAEIKDALEKVCLLLKEKNLEIDFNGDYDDRLKYSFITEELFEHETDNIQIPCLITHFIYEEFHPNHRLEIESRSIEFINGWFNQKIDEDSWELADNFILGNESTLSKKEVLSKIKMVFDAYTGFHDGEYEIQEINFELRPEKNMGMAYSKGTLSYEAELESGEKIHIEGPFNLCLLMEYEWWNIFYFVIPGFKW